MNTAMPATQRGLSFSGFIFGAFVLVVLGIFGLKLVPAYMQDATVKNLLVAIANDPEMQKASPSTIRMSFSKRSSIDDIKAIKAEDIEITKNGDRLVLSASYAVKVPVGGNVSLYLEFNPSSAN
ncbi:MAG: DUF4845 domain-containing protein [Nitrosomonadales bacterium]|nr:DUF4845 domain-containing protein [Nitrosomonadales bacterium]